MDGKEHYRFNASELAHMEAHQSGTLFINAESDAVVESIYKIIPVGGAITLDEAVMEYGYNHEAIEVGGPIDTELKGHFTTVKLAAGSAILVKRMD